MKDQPIITRRIEPDPEFDAALDADPEVREWIKHASFLLYARLNVFKDIADYSDRYELPELRCPECDDDYIAINK